MITHCPLCSEALEVHEYDEHSYLMCPELLENTAHSHFIMRFSLQEFGAENQVCVHLSNHFSMYYDIDAQNVKIHLNCKKTNMRIEDVQFQSIDELMAFAKNYEASVAFL